MKKSSKSGIVTILFIVSIIGSCNSNTKFEQYIDKEKKSLVKIEKQPSQLSESEKLIGCWSSDPKKMLESGGTVGEKMLQETKRLIFYKDSSFDEITLINSGIMNADPTVYHYPYYKVENGQFFTKETSHSNPIQFKGDSIILYGTTFTKGNCSE